MYKFKATFRNMDGEIIEEEILLHDADIDSLISAYLKAVMVSRKHMYRKGLLIKLEWVN